jgi:hypothetical protein
MMLLMQHLAQRLPRNLRSPLQQNPQTATISAKRMTNTALRGGCIVDPQVNLNIYLGLLRTPDGNPTRILHRPQTI